MNRIIVGITGASGSIYAKRLIESLLELSFEVHLVVTEQGEKVYTHELKSFQELLKPTANGSLILHDNSNLFSSIASGSFPTLGMVVIPCSMGTLGKIANGISDHLLTRCADVMIKERRPLILVTRETPLSPIHLENMLKLSRIGVTIFPPVPAFYHQPESIDELINISIGRILETLAIENPYHRAWRNPYE